MSNACLLDTNVVSEASKPKPNEKVVAWLQAATVHRLSVITLGELRKGFSLLPLGRRREDLERSIHLHLLRPDVVCIPVTEQIAVRWGSLTALRQQAGKPLPIADGLLAATALEYDLTLATHNTKDFTGLGLRLLDPWL